MIENLRVLAFIPARGGSRGLPNKNTLELCGKPMIAYTIQAALECGFCDEVIVSTESRNIASVAKQYGASIPFYRPKSLASDASRMMDVLDQAMQWYEETGNRFDLLLYLQPTSPLRNKAHIIDAFDVFFTKFADVIISVHHSTCHPQRLNTLPPDHCMKEFVDKRHEHLNRQEFDKYYAVNGAICLAKWEVLREKKSWYVDKAYAQIIQPPYCLDIDDRTDFEFAEFLIEKGYV